MRKIDPDLVRGVLHYDAYTGDFIWKERPLATFADNNHGRIWNNRFVGMIAGRPNPFGYRTIGINTREYYAHRLAWAHYYGEDPVQQIDHINGNRSDNRIVNLRKAPKGKNNQNTGARSHSIHSKYKGVGWHEKDKKWRARTAVNGVTKTKYFKNEIEAAKAYDIMAIEMHGEFAKTNAMLGLYPEAQQ